MTTTQVAAKPAAPMGVRVGARTVISLMIGRGAYRLAFQAANLALLLTWGTAVFGGYAAALGVSAWLMYVGVAVEKSALKLLPRTQRLVPRVVRLCLVITATPLVACLIALAVTEAVAPGRRATLYLLAATWFVSSGLLGVLAALQRLAGHPERDRRAFLALAVAIVASLLITWRLDLSPAGQLMLIDAAVVVLAVALAVTLPTAWRRVEVRHRRAGVLRALLRATVMLGTYDLASALAATVLYTTMAATGREDQTSPLYLALLISGVIGSALVYLLRIWQPHTSDRLRGTGAADGRRLARRLLALVSAGGLALLVVIAGYAATGQFHRRPAIGQVACFTAAEIVLFTLLTFATFLVENTDSAALRITSGSAVIGLAATALIGAPLVIEFGAAGAMATLGLAAAVQGTTLSGMLTRRYGETRGARSWRRKYQRAVAEAFATVPYYREWWSETGIGTPTPIDVAERRCDDLVPLRPPKTVTSADYGRRTAQRLGVMEKGGTDNGGTENVGTAGTDTVDARDGLPADAAPGTIAQDRLLGHFAIRGSCEQWHLVHPDFFAREVPGGIAYTALRSVSPRLVDIQLGEHAPSRLGVCPRHKSPTLQP
jgi:hypothetical protein